MAREVKPQELPDWLLARGRQWITTAEIGSLLDVPVGHVSPTVAGLVARGHLFSPTKGCYVPIPAEFREWGAVPASHFVDPLMAHRGHQFPR